MTDQRKVKLQFSLKSKKPNTAIKVTTSIRIPGIKAPKSWHLGYIQWTADIGEQHKRKFQDKLNNYWNEVFNKTTQPLIDWDDASEKLSKILLAYREQIDVPFTKVNDELWSFSDSKNAVGFIQREVEGKWVCSINDKHWGRNRVGSHLSLSDAKRAIIKHYKVYF